MISLIKLIDGTELVGEVNHTGDQVIINNPLQINYFMRSTASMPMVTLHRYMPFSETTSFSFYKDHIVTQVEPKVGMIEYYSATLKDIVEFADPSINSSLLEKVEMMSGESGDVAQALLERMVKKPTIN